MHVSSHRPVSFGTTTNAQPQPRVALPSFGRSKPNAPEEIPAHTPGVVSGLLEAPLTLTSRAAAFLGKPYIDQLPMGDGHPVLFIPGLLTGDDAMDTLAEQAANKNLKVYTADLRDPDQPSHGCFHPASLLNPLKGLHIPFNRRSHLDALLKRLEKIYYDNGCQKVSLVGWSMGGVKARELAKLRPDMVRDVQTMGSPIGYFHKKGGVFKPLNRVYRFMQWISPEDELFKQRLHQLHEAPPVPTTVIYSKNDGAAHWSVCVQERKRQGEAEAKVENVEIRTSHLGMPDDWTAQYVVLDRLVQPEGKWNPFDRQALPRLLFPEPYLVR